MMPATALRAWETERIEQGDGCRDEAMQKEGRDGAMCSYRWLSPRTSCGINTHTLHRLYRLALPFSCLNVPLLIHMKTISKLQTG